MSGGTLRFLEQWRHSLERQVIAKRCAQECYVYATQLEMRELKKHASPHERRTAHLVPFTDPNTGHVYFRHELPAGVSRKMQWKIDFWYRSAVRYMRLSQKQSPFRNRHEA